MTDDTMITHLQDMIDKRNHLVSEVDMLRETADQMVEEITQLDLAIVRADSMRMHD
jgi:hypothetical protein